MKRFKYIELPFEISYSMTGDKSDEDEPQDGF